MIVVGSVIARSGSKRLPYKNLLPFCGVPLVRHAVIKLLNSELFDQVVLSTDCDLIARTCMDLEGVCLLMRTEDLAQDSTASIPVFQDIIEKFPCDIHLNYNCNFPLCENEVFVEAIDLAQKHEESLSDPYAVWAQTSTCLKNYGNPFNITAKTFETKLVHPVDVHEFNDLLGVHESCQGEIFWQKR